MPWVGIVELAGGLLGLLGSIVLAVPVIKDVTTRRFWDRLRRLESLKGVRPEDVSAIKWLILDDILGGYGLYLRCTFWGCLLLVAGFAAIALGGGVRLAGG